ncbi:MAG: cytosine permease [Sulfolobales archaeon]
MDEGLIEVRVINTKDHPDLLPTPISQRTIGSFTYTIMILSMAITTSIFFLGWLSQILGLSLLQSLVAALVGNGVVAAIMTLNGWLGVKYGIPFPVQLRSSFGVRGSIVPLLVRAIVSIFWYGVDGYIAAWAITASAMLIAGFPPDAIVSESLRYTPITFVIYLAIVSLVGYKRIKGIKYLDLVAGPLLIIFFTWFVIYLYTEPSIPKNPVPIYEGRVGWISTEFFLMIAVQTAWWSTIALNVSDICRYNKSFKTLYYGHTLGLLVPQVVGTLLGFIATSLTGGIYSPIDIIAKYSPTPILGLFGLVFAFLATASTNVTGDVPAATNAIIRIARIRWENAVIIATILAWLVIGPYSIVFWRVSLDVANYLLLYNWYYSMWLGPIAGVMVIDYWVLRRRLLKPEELYNHSGIYSYYRGVNIAGISSFIISILIEYLLSALQGSIRIYFGFIPVPGIELAWYYGFISAALIYLLLAQAMKRHVLPEIMGVR